MGPTFQEIPTTSQALGYPVTVGVAELPLKKRKAKGLSPSERLELEAKAEGERVGPQLIQFSHGHRAALYSNRIVWGLKSGGGSDPRENFGRSAVLRC